MEKAKIISLKKDLITTKSQIVELMVKFNYFKNLKTISLRIIIILVIISFTFMKSDWGGDLFFIFGFLIAPVCLITAIFGFIKERKIKEELAVLKSKSISTQFELIELENV